MKVLITGMAGLIGAHLSRYLVSEGHEVQGIDDFSGGYQDFVPENVRNHTINLSESEALEWVFYEFQPEVVYHLAAYAAEGLSPFIRRHNYQNNVVCSANVINACLNHNVRKLVFTSSMAVYGEGKPPFFEYAIPRPIDPYGIAKWTVEQDIRLAGSQFGLDWTIVRPHNVVGIYQNIWDPYRNVIGIWIKRILDGEPLLIYGDGEQTRAFSDIRYYLEPFAKLMTAGSKETFNLGADKFWSINSAAELLCKVARKEGYKPWIKHVEARHEAKHAYCDHSKAKSQLDFEDHTDLEQTMTGMFRWARSQPNRPPRYLNPEVSNGIYSFWKHGSRNPVHAAAPAAAGAPV